MAIEIRPPSSAQIAEFVHVSQRHTGRPIEADDIEGAVEVFGFDRALAGVDDGAIVATALASAVELSVPGQAAGAAALITACATLPTHRRRGLLRALLLSLLEDARGRGEPFAVLGASQSGIYGRFGFGVAATAASCSVAPGGTGLRPARQPDSGRVRLIGSAEAARALPPLFDEWRMRTPGAIGRRGAWWQRRVRSISAPGERAREESCALYERPDGMPGGYAIYALAPARRDAVGEPDGELRLAELVTLGPAAYRVLWRHCLESDLVGRVTWETARVDEPLRWILSAPRRLTTWRVADALWLRLLDVEQALALRRYHQQGRVVLEVADAVLPGLAGRYVLDVGADGARCERSGETADVALDIADLASVYMGAATLDCLAGAGRVDEVTPGGLARASALLQTRTAPYCNADL